MCDDEAVTGGDEDEALTPAAKLWARLAPVIDDHLNGCGGVEEIHVISRSDEELLVMVTTLSDEDDAGVLLAEACTEENELVYTWLTLDETKGIHAVLDRHLRRLGHIPTEVS